MVNMHNNYRLHLLFLWRRKSGGQRVAVDVYYRILSDIDDGSPDMNAYVSVQQARDLCGLYHLMLPVQTKLYHNWVAVLENGWP